MSCGPVASSGWVVSSLEAVPCSNHFETALKAEVLKTRESAMTLLPVGEQLNMHETGRGQKLFKRFAVGCRAAACIHRRSSPLKRSHGPCRRRKQIKSLQAYTCVLFQRRISEIISLSSFKLCRLLTTLSGMVAGNNLFSFHFFNLLCRILQKGL